VQHVALFWTACAPAAIFVILLSKGLLGSTYEPDFKQLAYQMESMFGRGVEDLSWSLSAVTQAGLFFKYLALWLWPDTGGMSIDLRVNFFESWSPAWVVFKLGAFVAFGLLGIWLLRRRNGALALAGFGLLYAWVLYLVEFSVARFQEPFVLYRSYLWAPGIVLAVTALLSTVPYRIVLAAFALWCPLLFYQAHDRLVSLSSPLRVWEDAVAKLPAAPVPWGSRTLYNLGREYLYSGQPDRAIALTDRCIATYRNTFQCYYARAAIHLQLEQYEQALPYLTRALEIQPDNGMVYHRLGMARENLGQFDEAVRLYRRASSLGFKGADLELLRISSPGKGVAPPKARNPRTAR
jgi:tetratricopeptide (TPR) repeat protein